MIGRALLASPVAALLGASPALAVSPAGQFAASCGLSPQNLFGIQPWYACLPRDGLGNPIITKLSDVYLIIFPAIDSLVKVAALVAIGYIFFMLIKIMYARGDAGKIATATMGIRDAVIGLIIALISVAIVNFAAGSLS